ncbi:efflux RND transporter periplasmic adaptor subunit [Paracoccus denitrificans]|jgi:multidrug efflux pump subunit AcrA (membrane-fusion protein)|uniref:Transcriptional regulator, Fis family n=1 Tax=Paracoccus denitrificans (strain Pd 1222) TaxID=318586 RepID=A1B8W0_PARDP|nr:efflux RND transporter periplasmic adaptor subunit [Paracoccus denitrificans]ABL71954.1 transcriptional regulator, Fis family [Paracoccus denitrificans PD1222]MBB4626142.1 multidrug efflux pump subunit AcrA (membrane-fusion protein) [Paracoccus denitrificans]MCU7430590.1 efflux RND transporter periplasmic adaptor subunit [Paracoccus denitrificans]QAR28536.1 efflux RND transporter periplasmic adaptor subunit [Paracoccus denitrificans]UPV96679.1 efflux RND transporter periplasmic adaptor subu
MTATCRITRIAILALALSLSGSGLAAMAETAGAVEQAELPVVTLADAERGWIEARVPVSGSLVARQEVQVHALVSGHEITRLEAEVGDRVEAGAVLARLSEDVLSAQLAQAEAEYQRAEAGISQAESQIASAEASLTQAVATLERTRSLRQSGNASQAVLDQAIAAEASARAAAASASDGLGVARAALAQAAAARRIAQLNLGHASVTAPVDGVVVARTARLGAIPGSGGEPLFTLIAGGEVELEADVIETALSQLKAGDAAEIQVAGLGRVQGKLRLVPAAVDPVTRLGPARIALDPDPRLRPGLFASGWIITDRREAVTVPASAILADASGERVQVVKDGQIETREVRGGLVWQGRREILDGLAPGETVVARAGAFFRSGDQVRAAP